MLEVIGNEAAIQMLKQRQRIFLFLLLMTGSYGIAQEQSQPDRFRFTLGAGIVPTSEKYLFLGVNDPAPLKTGYYVAATASYNLGMLISPSCMDIGIHLSHLHSTTGLVGRPPDEAELAYWSTNLLLVSRISVSGTLSPYVEAGVGICQLRFSKDYVHSTSFDDRGIVTGPGTVLGGGLSLAISQHLQLDGFVQIIRLHRKLKITFVPNPYEIDTPARVVVGLRAACSI